MLKLMLKVKSWTEVPGVSEGLVSLTFKPKVYLGALSNTALAFSGQ